MSDIVKAAELQAGDTIISADDIILSVFDHDSAEDQGAEVISVTVRDEDDLVEVETPSQRFTVNSDSLFEVIPVTHEVTVGWVAWQKNLRLARKTMRDEGRLK